MFAKFRQPFILFTLIAIFVLLSPTQVFAKSIGKAKHPPTPKITVTWENKAGESVSEISEGEQLNIKITGKKLASGVIVRYRVDEQAWRPARPQFKKCHRWFGCSLWKGRALLIPVADLKVGNHTVQVQVFTKWGKTFKLTKHVKVIPTVEVHSRNCKQVSEVCWQLPFAGDSIVTSGYGMREGGFHDGIDFGLSCNTKLYVISEGRVVKTNTTGIILGNSSNPSTPVNSVVVRHANGYESMYLHLNSVIVKPGDDLVQGQLLGTSGNTGYVRGNDASPLSAQGCHLHLQISKSGTTLNPASLLPI